MQGRGVHIHRPPVGGPAGALEDGLRPPETQLGGVEFLVWACAVWACVCSRGLVLIRLEDCESRWIYLHVPMFLRRPVVSCNYRPEIKVRGVL